MTAGQIKGDGFSLQASRRDQHRGGISHGLIELMVSASLLDLSLMCWNAEALAAIRSSFGTPHRASLECLCWDDLTSFDINFFCEEMEDIPDSINVTIEPFIYNVEVRSNCHREGSIG